MSRSAAAPTLLLLLLSASAAAAETLAGLIVPTAAAARARVEVWPQCPPVPEPGTPPLAVAKPGADGRFRIEVPPGEAVWVRVQAEGFLPAEREWLEGADPELPPVRLKRAEPLELALAAPDGKPHAGVPLDVFPAARAAAAEWHVPVRRAVTGPDGRAALPRAPGEALVLIVASPRLLGAHELGAGSAGRLVLAPGSPVTLTVSDPVGRPVAGARIQLLSAGTEVGRTGPAGRLELSAPAGALDFVLTIEDGAGRQTETRLRRGAEGALAATLQPARQVSGRVVDARTRQPVAGARVGSTWFGLSCRATARTGADGAFQLALGPRDTALAAGAAGYQRAVLDLRDSTQAGPFTLALEPAAALAVRVVDERGTPVAGAWVSAFPSGAGDRAAPLAAVSGLAGTVRLQAAAGVLYEVTAARDGFAPGSTMARASPAPGEPAAVVLTRGASARGRLIGEDGEPVAGGEVALQQRPEDLDGRPEEPARRAAAGPDGRFELLHLPPGRYRLSARAPGRAPVAQVAVEVPAGVRQVDLGDLPLAAGTALAGRVVDERDRPLAGAKIQVVSVPAAAPPAVSGADGGFRLADLAPGRADLSVVREGYLQVTLRGVAVPAAEPLIVRLRPGRSLAGRVTGLRGEPVAHATVYRLYFSEQDPGRFTGSSSTSLASSDGEGRFLARGLDPGPLALLVEAPGYRPRQLRIEIPDEGDPDPLEIALETGAEVEGRVLAAGQPLAGVFVSAYPTSSAGPQSRALAATDGDGRYRLAGLAAGRHRIELVDTEGRQAAEELEVRPGRQELDLHLPGGGLAGRVVDAAGAPVAGADLWANGPQNRHARSAPDGAFAFPSLPPGPYRLAARHPEAGRAKIPEVQVADRTVALPDLALEPGAVAGVAGRLLGLDDRDLARAWVMAEPLQEGRGGVVQGRVGPEGAYRIAGLLPGRWRIRAGAGERRPAAKDLQLAPDEQAALDLEIAGGATLAGRVVVDGLLGSGLRVILGPDGGATATGHDGTFALRDIPAGSYHLTVVVGPKLEWYQPVEIQEDRTIEVQVATGILTGRVLSPAGPVARVHVSAEAMDGLWHGLGPDALTGGDGAFRFRLQPGRYRLQVRADGTAYSAPDVDSEVEVPAGGEAQVELQLP